MMKILTVVSLLCVLVFVGCDRRLPATDHVSVAAHRSPAGEETASSKVSAEAAPPAAPSSDESAPVTPPAHSSSELSATEVALVPDSPPPTPPTAQRPPADRTPSRPGEAEKITFEDLNLGMQADVVFRPFMLTDRVKDLEDKRISISGYMHAGQSSQRGIKDFILLKNTQCKFGPGGQADHLANVVMREGSTTSFTPSPIKIEGTLKIEPFQGPDNNTWYIYRLEGAQIR